MKTSELRKKYLEFFEKKNHKFFASDTLVPDDASLLFTSAGMNQFKPYFLGEKKDIARAVSCQKCLRTGDLEKVGKTAYHHTFFEMLGNFSFGNYFKKEAIEFAWEFLIKDLDIDAKKLWVSVYKDDDEAYSIWKDKIGVPAEKIVKLGEDSNFWPANAPSNGPNGPCGPCSEIFFDQEEDVGCKRAGCNPDCSCGRFVEVWNLVFTQFNRVGVNKLEPLPQKNIDTGMGLERMAAVLQGKESNFEIDILAPVVEEVRKMVDKSSRPEKLVNSSVNAIVDHARAATFAIADGVYPSNEGRGYVIRKITRRALLKARGLGNKQPFLFKLPEFFVQLMGSAYPEIKQKKDNISQIILSEEEKYFLMLEEGKIRASAVIRSLKASNKKTLRAEDAFRLYDTYGVPLEMLKDFAKGFKVDEKGFAKLLKDQQERSRKKSMFDESIFAEGKLNLVEKTEFIGYKLAKSIVRIERVFLEPGLVILDKTPFYPSSGGQLCDKGIISTKKGEFEVLEVFKVNDAIVHKGKIVKGKIEPGIASAIVDLKRREALARAHTATHLLQAALRKVLGDHVTQQGSLVDEDSFRFDFTHFNRLTDAERKKVGDLVRKFVKSGDRVRKKEVSFAEAKKEGALAFFKDKYQDKVRVVSISDYSKELCGGIHVNNTTQINDFEIERESSISSGIRRIRASVGKKAQVIRNFQKKVDKVIKKEKKANQAKIGPAVAEEEARVLRKIPELINQVNFLFDYDKIDSISSQEEFRVMLRLSDRLRQKIDSGFIFIVREVAGKNIFVCSVTDDLIKKGITSGAFIDKFKKELSLAGGKKDKTNQGAVGNMGADFVGRVKGAFAKFTKK